MGALGRIAITGAAGYLGRACLSEARRRGHPVTALVRAEPPDRWRDDPGIDVARHDLAFADDGDLARTLSDAVAVIHLAAHMGDAPEDHARDTLGATERLLAAVARAGTPRLVLGSSIAVYAPPRLSRVPQVVDETSSRTAPGTTGDAYAEAKIAQEILCEDAACTHDFGLRLLRIGAVWGPGRLWNAHIGPAFGPLLLRVGTAGDLPLAHVDTVAAALLDAATCHTGGLRTLNVVDDDRPDRLRFLAAHRAVARWPRAVLPLPWPILAAAAGPLAPLGAHLPGLLRRPVLARRMAPARYPNAALRAAFGPRNAPSFEERMAQAARGAPQ